MKVQSQCSIKKLKYKRNKTIFIFAYLLEMEPNLVCFVFLLLSKLLTFNKIQNNNYFPVDENTSYRTPTVCQW